MSVDPSRVFGDVESVEDLRRLCGGDPDPAWTLACLFQRAYDIPPEDWQAVKKDSWTDDGEEWAVYLNGSGRAWTPAVETVGIDYPSPARVEVPAGAHHVRVDGDALAVLHPTHPELFVDEAAASPWESAVHHALRDRLTDLGLDIPRVTDLVQEADA